MRSTPTSGHNTGGQAVRQVALISRSACPPPPLPHLHQALQLRARLGITRPGRLHGPHEHVRLHAQLRGSVHSPHQLGHGRARYSLRYSRLRGRAPPRKRRVALRNQGRQVRELAGGLGVRGWGGCQLTRVQGTAWRGLGYRATERGHVGGL